MDGIFLFKNFIENTLKRGVANAVTPLFFSFKGENMATDKDSLEYRIAIQAALDHRDQSTIPAVRALSDKEVIRAVNKRLGLIPRPKHKQSAAYRDPTGMTAASRVDRSRKSQK